MARGVRLLLLGALLAVVGQVVAWPRVPRADILVVDTTVDSAALIVGGARALAPSDLQATEFTATLYAEADATLRSWQPGC